MVMAAKRLLHGQTPVIFTPGMAQLDDYAIFAKQRVERCSVTWLRRLVWC